MSALNRNNVEGIKARLSIEELIGSYIKIEKSGKSYKARCPFHNEKSPSFFISPDRGGYYCFGCNAKGDIFSFVEQFEGLDFRGALKVLAEKAGVKLTHDDKADGERDRLHKVIELATAYFEDQLMRSKEAQEYIKTRGITDDTRKMFRIGYAPEGWRHLLTYLKGKGFNEAVMEKVGLIKHKEQSESSLVPSAHLSSSTRSGIPQGLATSYAQQDSYVRGNDTKSDYYDRFRGRIMFPISDSSGRVIAFSGRILKDVKNADGSSPAKYLNSPDTPLYDKSLVLYGLDKAKAEIRRLNYTIFVEGQMDLVMSHQAGIRNTVASSGTALSEETNNSAGIISNLGLVRRLSPNVIIAFDSDNAGRKAALRAAGIALALGMDVKIADIVGGKDPADLVKDDIEKWRQTLKDAKPVIEFELGNVVREIQDSRPVGRTDEGRFKIKDSDPKNDPRKLTKMVTERVLPLVARIESSSDQSHFVAMIADQAKIPIDSVWTDVKIVAKRIKEAEIAANPAPVAGSFGSNSAPQLTGRNAIAQARTSSEMPKRIDLIERRLFGLLFLMESVCVIPGPHVSSPTRSGIPQELATGSAQQDSRQILFPTAIKSEDDTKTFQIPKESIEEYYNQIKKMAGDSYESRLTRATQNKSDLMFEAESFFGIDPAVWHTPMKELLSNFEEDILSDEIMTSMHELKLAEKIGDHTRVSELAQKCQALSIRKAEVGRRG
jgi:DNA primase